MSAGRIPTTANSPLTTKGDLFTYSTASAKLAVGANNTVLIADSAQATGLKYANGSVGTLTTTGDILYASAANTPARLGIGTTGQVLNVASGIPAWTTPSAGALTKISTQTFSGVATVTFDSQFTSTYKLYFVSATRLITTSPYAGVTFRFRKGGVTTTATYTGSQEYLPANYSGYAPVNSFNNSTANLNFIGTDNRPGSATMYITNVGTGGGDAPTMWGTGLTGSSQGYQIFAGSNSGATTEHDGFILDVSGCNMSGTVTVYGVQA